MNALTMIVLALALGLPAESQFIAIRNVNVVDARDSLPRANQTVVVRGNRIQSVAMGSAIPAGARVIDGRGKYLIPGLWDMHVHTDVVHGGALLALYVLNGVTGVRDMAGSWETLQGWRSEIAAAVATSLLRNRPARARARHPVRGPRLTDGRRAGRVGLRYPQHRAPAGNPAALHER